jgi:hypothetical protein
MLGQFKSSKRKPLNLFGERTGGDQYEIAGRGPRRCGIRPHQIEIEPPAGNEGQFVADIGEGDEADEIVIAVRPHPKDSERQVHLGGGAASEAVHGE